MRLLTHNVGSATPAEVVALLDGCTTAALQEMGDRQDIYRAVREAGWEFIPVVGPERSTPLAYAPDVRLIKPITFLLTPATVVESGGMRDLAGPDEVKAKYFVGGLFERDGRRFISGSIHYPASQWHEGRERLARRATRRIVRRFYGRRIPVFVGADWNTTPEGESVARFRRSRAWHLIGGTKATHGKRAIDYFWGRGKFRVLAVHRHRTRSDHLAVIAEVAW